MYNLISFNPPELQWYAIFHFSDEKETEKQVSSVVYHGYIAQVEARFKHDLAPIFRLFTKYKFHNNSNQIINIMLRKIC